MRLMVIIIIHISSSIQPTLTSQKIKDQFLYCESSNDIFEVDEPSCDRVCKNELNMLNKYQDEFNYFYLNNEDKKVVYSLNGLVFDTNCTKVEEIEVAPETDICSKDIYVSWNSSGQAFKGFLTKTGKIKQITI